MVLIQVQQAVLLILYGIMQTNGAIWSQTDITNGLIQVVSLGGFEWPAA